MSTFNLKINALENGWADLSLSVGEDKKTLYFENVPVDTMYEILESARRIAGGIESIVTLYNGSYREYLSIRRVDSDFCHIEIDDWCFKLPIRTYCKAILRMFDTYVYQFSTDTYTRNWGVFPQYELEKLRAQYHAL